MDRLQVASALVVLDDAGERATRQHRVLDVHDRRKRLVLDVDELDRVRCGRLGLGDDERDGLPSEDDLRAGERLRRTVRPTSRDGEVVRGQDGDHPRGGERRVAVDVPDERVRLGRKDEAAVRSPRTCVSPASGLPR